MKKKINIRKWNKKGTIFGDIGNFFQGIIQLMPKWLRIIILLGIILFIGNLLTYIFNFIGIYCTSGEIPVTIGFNPLKTAELIGKTPTSEEIATNSIRLNSPMPILSTGLSRCSYSVGNIEGSYIYYSDTKMRQNLTEPEWFYDGGFCTNCSKAMICPANKDCNLLCTDLIVHRLPDDKKSIFQKAFCGGVMGGCEPPTNYYYNANTNHYECESVDCGGTGVAEDWDNILKNNNANLLYNDLNDTNFKVDYKHVIGITCSEVRPRLAIFTIDVFNYQYWLFIIVIVILFFIYKHFKGD